MDAKRFDLLAKAVSAEGSRRGLLRLLGLLGLLPLAGWMPALPGEAESAAKRRKHRDRDRSSGRQKGRGQVGADNHKHEGRRRKHRNKRNHDHKHKQKKGCKSESTAQTCEGQCGGVRNNCKKMVDCGPCDCSPACPLCQVCNPDTIACAPDPAQVGDACGDGLVCQGNGACACSGQSCGGCRVCDGGTCVPDTSIVCTAQDQCHAAGDCDPNTGQCTTPRKDDGTRCEAADRCVVNARCQQGVCTGTPRDCTGEADPCNDGVCQADGSCGKAPKPNGTGCNADNTSCTDGDSCQGGVCTPGAGVDCSSQDDQCNTGVCDPATGQGGTCAPGTPLSCPVCQACRGGSCQNLSSDAGCATVCCGGVCCDTAGTCDGEQCPVICLALREACDPSDNQCCDASCGPNRPNCGDEGNHCCLDPGEICTNGCECCGESSCEGDACCHLTRGSCQSAADCCQNFFNQQDCVAGHCCALPDEPCEGPDDCCEGLCDPVDSVCTGCIALQRSCEDESQCCQRGGPTHCAPSCNFDIATCCRPPGGACGETCDCCDQTTCCNGVCCGKDEECVNNTCRPICRQQGQVCLDAPDSCCPGAECRSADFQTICRPAMCLEFGEECWTIGSRPCCTGECTTVISGEAKSCCSPEGGVCHDLGVFFSGGHCCGTNVCNGADRCAGCRQEGETCDGGELPSSNNCCNILNNTDPPLRCMGGVCVRQQG